ncbi:MAG: hypothetical protein RR478_03320 [Bacilli bacterium]
MDLKEVSDILKRISSHYNSFIIDDFKKKEWYRELKDYDYDDVNFALEKHLKNSEYGQYEPKLYYLTKFLKKKSEKGKEEILFTNCQLCGVLLNYNDYNSHYKRCSSITWIAKQWEKYKSDTNVNFSKLGTMSDEEFDKYYDNIIQYVYDNTNDEIEMNILKNVIASKNEQLRYSNITNNVINKI